MDNTSPNIFALCATPRFMNTGMRCVDEALYFLLQRLDLLEYTQFFCFDPPARDLQGRPIHYHPLTQAQTYSKYDLIILWGDFIITRKWLQRIIPIMLGKKMAESKPRLQAFLEQKVLLAQQTDAILQKTIVYGQSLMNDGREIFHDSEYFRLLERLLGQARFVRLRDPYSAYQAALITQKNRNFMGLDAALLLPSLTPEKPIQPQHTQSVGVFFGRTANSRQAQLIFAKALHQQYPHCQCHWIPWLQETPQQITPRWRIRNAFKLQFAPRPDTIAEFMRLLRTFHFIITDTYHLSLMAWANGIPALCLGNGAEHFSETVHDKKKEVFYFQNYLADFYFFNEHIVRDYRNESIQAAMRKALSGELGPQVQKRLHDIAAENIRALKKAIYDILEIPPA